MPAKKRRVLFITDFYLEEALLGVVDHAREQRWELIANMRFHGLFPSESEADGIIATVTSKRVRDWLARWKHCPIVQMLTTPFEDLKYPSVEPDYAAAGREGARHLLELGHTNFAFYWLHTLKDTVEALSGFETELTAAGRSVHRLDFPGAHKGRSLDVPRDQRLNWLATELRLLPKPVAIMSDDDRRALELLAACEKAGLRVPDDVALLGCDNRVVELSLATVPISSVDMNLRGVGHEAAALLTLLMDGGQAPSVLLKVPASGVVARHSTATFSTDSPGINAAVVHIRQYFHETLRLAELARIAGLSERVFELEFKRRVGRTARAEIQRTRLAKAARLLRDTDLKLDAVAAESGFGTARKLCAVFADVHGTTPTAWRQRAQHGR